MLLTVYRSREGCPISQFGVSTNTFARRDKKKHIFLFFCHPKYTHEFAFKKNCIFKICLILSRRAHLCFLKLRTSLYTWIMRFLACYLGIIKCPANQPKQTTVDAVLRLKGTFCDVLQNCHESHYVHILDMYVLLETVCYQQLNNVFSSLSHIIANQRQI